MEHSIFQKELAPGISADIKKNVGILFAIFVSIIALTIFEDFLESGRGGYAFYFGESILFKTVWILFVPILTFLRIALNNRNLESFGKTTFFIATPIIIHLVLLPLVFLFFSAVFFNGRYDLYKVLTYTLANDLYKLVIIYSVFVFGYRHLFLKSADTLISKEKFNLQKLIIGNGKMNKIVEIKDIYTITAATPYISINLEEKKHLHTKTLKSISTQLDPHQFVRIHKSTIVNLDKIVSFKSRLNGDYDISLINGAELRLSRTFVANFKNKFENTHRVER